MHRSLRARQDAGTVSRGELLRWIFALPLLAACGKTPADAIVPEALGPDGGDSCSEGAPSVAAGLFRLRSTAGQCLDIGSSTIVGSSPAHQTIMVDDCAASEIWELKATTSSVVFGSVYEVATTTLDETLDITMAMTDDGTPAITFASFGIPNQKFQFRPRRPRVFAMAPAHVIGQTSCLSSLPPQPAIQPCSVAATDQEWLLVPADCG